MDKFQEDLFKVSIDDKYTKDLNNFDIVSIFGKEYLEQIQNMISEVTGLAFVTVDYKGEPITNPTNFTHICQKIRQDPMIEPICKLSDASGAIRAAVTKKTSIYFCPFEMLEVAIPIVINDKYLGAFIGGQARCFDAPKEVYRMQEQLLLHDLNLENIKEDENEKIYSYKEFKSVVKLIEFIILEIVKKEIISNYYENKNKSKIDELNNKLKKSIEENEKLVEKIKIIDNNLNKFFILNSVESISNLMIVEDIDLLAKYIDNFRNYINQVVDNDQKSMYEMIEGIKSYLSLKLIEYEDRLTYEINYDNSLNNYLMPYRAVLPYVYAMTYLGLVANDEEYKLKLDVKRKEDIEIYISDNRKDVRNMLENTKLYNDKPDIKGIFDYLQWLNSRIKVDFGEDYKIIISETTKGTEVFMKFPLNKDESWKM